MRYYRVFGITLICLNLFTPLEKAHGEIGDKNKEIKDGSMPSSAHTAKELSSLTGFTMVANSQSAKFVYDSKDKRDPFIPYISKDGKILTLPGMLGEVVLEGIVYDPKGNSVCVIDGTVLREGETCENFKVLKIKVDSIIVSCNNKEYEIEVRKEEGNGKQKTDETEAPPAPGN